MDWKFGIIFLLLLLWVEVTTRYERCCDLVID